MDESPRSDGRLSDLGILGWGIFVGIAVVALLVAAYVIGVRKGEGNARGQEPTVTQAATAPAATTGAAPAVDAAAKAAFAATCGGCHTLAAAGTSGTVGPDLDDLKPTAEQVATAIANGGAGSGQMPAGLLSGEQATKVAEFVASSAGG